MARVLLSSHIRRERDIVHARQCARLIAESLRFDSQDQTRIATAVSEIARNAFSYAEGGRVAFLVEGRRAPYTLLIRISDRGSGIPDLNAVLSGAYRSTTGLGAGLSGAQRLVDRLVVDSGGDGTTVRLYKAVPAAVAEPADALVRRVMDELSRRRPFDPVDEVQRQNRELLRSLGDLSRREEQLRAAHQELAQHAETLQRNLSEKQILLREIYHRVKNNLQIISSIVSLQAHQADDPNVRRHLADVRNRIESLSIIHERLYQSDDIGRIDLQAYVRDLCAQLRSVYAPDGRRIALDIECDHVILPLDAAIQIGLLINEIVTNSFKHGFPDDATGTIRIAVTRRPDRLELVVHDTGRGIPAERRKPDGGSLGLTIVEALARGLGGSVAVDGSNGTTVRVDVPDDPTGAQRAAACPEQSAARPHSAGESA